MLDIEYDPETLVTKLKPRCEASRLEVLNLIQAINVGGTVTIEVDGRSPITIRHDPLPLSLQEIG